MFSSLWTNIKYILFFRELRFDNEKKVVRYKLIIINRIFFFLTHLLIITLSTSNILIILFHTLLSIPRARIIIIMMYMRIWYEILGFNHYNFKSFSTVTNHISYSLGNQIFDYHIFSSSLMKLECFNLNFEMFVWFSEKCTITVRSLRSEKKNGGSLCVVFWVFKFVYCQQ